jgi:hypothetical protein
METNPQEVSSMSVEDTLAAAFERNGVTDDPTPDEVEADEPEAVSDEETTDDEPDAEAQDAEPADDAEEVEYEGKSYKLPKELKEALLRQQDYTRKTQDVAERRRSVDEQAQAVQLQAQFNQAHFAKTVEAHSLNARLQQFAQVNWAELAENNAAQYLQLDRQHRELQEAAHRANAEIQQLGQQFQAQAVQNKQKAQARCIEELRKDFKDFGPDLLRSLDETGRAFGFTAEELSNVTDPRMIRVLHAATQLKKMQSKSIADKKVNEAPPVKAKVSRTAQSSMQSAQTSELRDRLRKTGRSDDAEAFLAARFAKQMRELSWLKFQEP